MPDPLGSELGIVVDEITYGRALDAALERLDNRVGLPDLRALRIAVDIQDGGDLAHTLDGLARLSRSRSGTCAPRSSFSET
jgi:tight adherence protein B